MSQLCLRRKTTACSRKEAFALAMSSMPSQAASVDATTNGTQTNPAFCSQRSSPVFATVCGAPPRPPKTPAVMTSGTTNCIADTPRLPSPALRPSAVPFCSFGKKKLMLAMLDAKFPPPKPHSSASASIVPYDVVGSCTARPMPSAGTSSEAVLSTVQSRPPKTGTMNE